MVELALSAFWAFWMGALSAIRPSSRKSIVGAYLAETRGRPREALILTLAVTGTQAGGVIALGLLSASVVAVFVPKHALTWIQIASGAVVLGVGIWMLFGGAGLGRRAETPYRHSGELADGKSTRPARLSAGLVALGAAGGMVPSPEALAVFVAAVGRGELVQGVALVLAYSLGMASTLALVGLATLRASAMVSSRLARGQAGGKLVSVLAGLLVCAMGVALIVAAFRGSGR